MNYATEFLHAYSMHFGFWISFQFAATIYKNGIPEMYEIREKLVTALILASILSIFSSHSQAHYLSHFVGKV